MAWANARRNLWYTPSDGRRTQESVGDLAAILAARKLSQQEHVRNVPATIYAMSDAVAWAERIMKEIESKGLVKP